MLQIHGGPELVSVQEAMIRKSRLCVSFLCFILTTESSSKFHASCRIVTTYNS